MMIPVSYPLTERVTRVFRVSDLMLHTSFLFDVNSSIPDPKVLYWLPELDEKYIIMQGESNRIEIFNIDSGKSVRSYIFGFDERVAKVLYNEAT
jgi:hypothetical protein